MSINKNALIRYKTIDACLQNRYRKWTLEKLVEACSDALYEYEGIHKGVSVRTVQLDIQLMRSEKLGYNAPIVVVDKKFYTYEDPKYSIANIPLTTQDLSTLGEVVGILKQFKGFTHFQEVDSMIGRLEHKIFVGKNQQSPVIDFEKNERLVGLEHLAPLYEAITKKQVLDVVYQSFKAHESQTVVFQPQLLKEYRNRWFVLGFKGGFVPPQLLALDRIKNIAVCTTKKYVESTLDASYFDDIIGVSKNVGLRPQRIVFKADAEATPYILTKPLHSSQKVEEETDNGTIISITVAWNFELERELLGFGENIEVLLPKRLRYVLKKRLTKMMDFYEDKGDDE